MIAALYAESVLDDERFARRFTEDKRALEGWGRERIERELARRGVVTPTIGRAVTGSRETECEAARRILAQRFPAPLEDSMAKNRALGYLTRKGYALEVAHDAIRGHQRHELGLEEAPSE